jgi:hypothetical protein
MSCDRVPRLLARLVVDYFTYVVRSSALAPRVARLVVNHFAYAARKGASARRAARRRLLRPRRASGCHSTSRSSSHGSSSTSRAARRRLLRLRRASGCHGTSRGSSRGSSSTTSPTPHVRVPQHVAWFVARLIVDYFAHAVRPDASTHRAARRMAPCAARRRLLRLTWLIVDYFAYTMRPGASARRAARRRLLLPHCASGCLDTSRGSSHGSLRGPSSTTLPHAARRRLLRLHQASGCLGTSRGSSLTTSPTSCVRVPRHVARYIA